MFVLRSALVAGLASSVIFIASQTPAAALPFTYAPAVAESAELPILKTQLQQRRAFGGQGRPVRQAPAPRRGGGGNAAGAAVAAGVLGIIAGGIIASQSQPRTLYQSAPPNYYDPRYYPPQRAVPVYEQEMGYGPQPGSRAWYDYCSRRYRSFDPRSGTYRGYDGQLYPCE